MTTPNPTNPARRTTAGPGAALAWAARRRDMTRAPWRDELAPPVAAAVRVDMGRRTIHAPDDPTTLGRTLQLHATIAARYGLTTRQRADLARRLPADARPYLAAAEWLAHRAQVETAAARTKRDTTYDDGTAHVLAAHLDKLGGDLAYRYALAHLRPDGTLPDQLRRALKRHHPAHARELHQAAETIAHYASEAAQALTHTAPRSPHRRYGRRALEQLARTLARTAAAAATTDDDDDRDGPGTTPEPTHDPGKLWAELTIERPPLPIANHARTGRRYIPRDAGKAPRYMARALTDPARRVFSARGGQRWATVVLDCSGSMSHDHADLMRLIELARGCSVLAYRTRNGSPSAQIMARDGRACEPSRLMRPGGGNGVDGPAVTWAHRYLRRRGAPLIWVSDGGITGRNEHHTPELARDMVRRLRETGAHQVRNIAEAAAVLDAMRAGHNPRPHIDPDLLNYANR